MTVDACVGSCVCVNIRYCGYVCECVCVASNCVGMMGGASSEDCEIGVEFLVMFLGSNGSRWQLGVDLRTGWKVLLELQ